MMGKLRIFLAAAGLLSAAALSAETITVTSPGQNLVVTINYDTNAPLTFSVKKQGEEVMPASPLGLLVNGKHLGEGVQSAGKVTTRSIREEYPFYGNHAIARNYGEETTIPLKSNGITYKLQVRAYDDGAAVRYVIDGKKRFHIDGEATAWTFPERSRGFWADYTIDYEALHQVSRFDRIPEGKPIVVPFTADMDGRFTPELTGKFVAVTEADNRTFADMVLRREGNLLVATFPACPDGWDAVGPVASPWRAMIVADNLTQLVNSDLVTNLCEAPAAGSDFSWVKPGRALWQWWSSGEPLYEDQPAWYDAAARLTWEYYLIDDGWRVWSADGMDQWACLKAAIDYGKSVGVETLMWVNSNEMRTRPEIAAYLDKVKAAGAAGIKIDFIPEATPDIIRWYLDALEETAERQLLCNFHGCIKPSGLTRTWPHELTREAVRGHEYHISRYDRVMPKDQDAIKPFTRLLAGAADFTPTAFVPEELLGYTWPHELAQAIIYTSPLTHFADSYIHYLNNPTEDLLRDIPVVWDETIVLPCTQVGRVAAIARRSERDYWLGVVGGESEITLRLDMSFLPGPMMATEIADMEGVDDAVVRTERLIRPKDRISLKLRPGGGYVLRMKPVD